jgi:hypothetical protein
VEHHAPLRADGGGIATGRLLRRLALTAKATKVL